MVPASSAAGGGRSLPPRLSISTSTSPENSLRRPRFQGSCLALCDWITTELCFPPFDKLFERRLVRQTHLVTIFGIAALLANFYPGVLTLFVRHQSPHVYPSTETSETLSHRVRALPPAHTESRPASLGEVPQHHGAASFVERLLEAKHPFGDSTSFVDFATGAARLRSSKRHHAAPLSPASFLAVSSNSSPHIIVPRLTEDLHSFTKGLFWVLTFVGVTALIPLQLSLLLCTVPLTDIQVPQRRNDCIFSIISVNSRVTVYNCLCSPVFAVLSAHNFVSYYTADTAHLRAAIQVLAYTAVGLAVTIHLPLALHVYNFTRFFEGAAAFYQLHESLSAAPPGSPFRPTPPPRKISRRGDDEETVHSRPRILARLLSCPDGHRDFLSCMDEKGKEDAEDSPLLP